MRKILLFLIMLRSLGAWSQMIKVLDISTGTPIEGVIFFSDSPNYTDLTNAKGQIDITPWLGAEIIHIQLLGYKNLIYSYVDLANLGGSLSMELESLPLDAIIVSGSRWRQSSDRVPSKIITISAKEVAFQNPQTAADLLGISSKVFIQKSQQGGGSPMIRGFATNRLVYTVDGVRMNTAIFRGGNLQNVINIDPFATEHTEVLFGPGSVIYGSDAIGGVMAFQTLTPQFTTSEKMLISGKVSARYSSANQEKTGHADIHIGWKKWAFVTSISSWNFDHLRQGSNGPHDYIKKVYVESQGDKDVVLLQEDTLLQIPSAYRQYNVMQKIRFKAGKHLDLQYGFHYSATSSYGRYDRHNRMRNGTLRYAEWDYGPQKWMMNNLSINHKSKGALYEDMSMRLAYQIFDESRIDRSLNNKNRNTQSENVKAYSANLDFVKSLNNKNKLFYGLEYVLNDVTSTGVITDITKNIDSEGASRYPQSTWQSAAVYVNDEHKINEKLTMQAGIRYNTFALNSDFSNNLSFFPLPFSTTKIQNGALTGSIGGVYRASESLVLRANAGTAFRSPNVDDLGKIFDSGDGFVTVPNPDLQAENAYNMDLGFAKVFSDRVKLDFSAYYTTLKNALVRRNYTLNGQDSILYDGVMSKVQAIQNAAVANVYGIQAGIEIKMGYGISFLTDWNFQKGEEELDDTTTSPSRHAAPLFGSNRLRYQKNKLILEMNTFHQGEKSFDDLPQEEQAKTEIYAKDSNGNSYAPSWYTLNFKAMYQLPSGFVINAGLENITDQRYRPYSSGISGAGRNASVGIHWSF